MPNRSQWMVLIAAAIFFCMMLSLAFKKDAPESTPGKQAFRQRLIAVGDLHGGAYLTPLPLHYS